MTSRERLLNAVDHRPTDRLPIFKPNIMNTEEAYDSELMRYLDEFDFDAFTGIGGVRERPDQGRDLGNGESVDRYGCRFKYLGVGMPYCVHAPLANAESVADVDALDWFDPHAPDLIEPDAADKAKAARETGEKLTTVNVGTLFHRYHYLRGFEQWMLDVKLNRDIHRAIADHIYHINSVLCMRLLEQVGPYTDMVATGDDFGWSTAPYMSPADFRALIKPYYKDLIGRIKTRFPHIKFYLHSHGQIMDMVPDLIECGVDVLNPVLPLDNMDHVRLKREFGKDLCFHGGVDVEHVIPYCNVGDVKEHVKRVIDTLGPGGFWFKLQVISPIIPPANIVAAYDTAREYGMQVR